MSAARRIAASSAGAVALGDDGEDRAAAAALALQHRIEQPREQRIRAHDRALLVDGGDRHRRVLEEAHEAHFGGAQRIAAVVAGAIDDQRARRARRAVGAERDLVVEPRRNGAAALGLEIDVEQLGLHLAGRRRQRGEQRAALAGDDVAKLQSAGADLGEVLLEPLGQRRVEIGDVAVGIDREEAGRRVVEIVDGVLQFLEDVFLPLELAGDVGDRPHRELRLALAFAERPHPHAQPAPGLAAHAVDAHLLLQAAALARRLEQAEDRLRDAGIADEHALDRPHVVGARWRRPARDRRHWRRSPGRRRR